MRYTLTIATTLLLLSEVSHSLVQPDISAIGDFRAYTGNWKNADGTATSRNENLNMNLEELEIALTGALNPYANGNFIVSTSGDGTIDIEEGYATIIHGLPLKSQLKVGKSLVDFGKLNTNHAHAFDFIYRPLSHQVFFGPEGFKDIGVNLNFLLPTSWYTKLSLNVLKGELFTQSNDSARGSVKPIYSGRLNCFVPIGERGDLDIGLSGLFGTYLGRGAEGTGDIAHGYRNLNAVMWALDAKYKFRWSDYSNIIVQGELIGNRRERFASDLSHVSNLSGFAFVDYRFMKRYNAGVMFDRAPGILDSDTRLTGQSLAPHQSNTERAPLDTRNSTQAVTLFTGFSLLEETTLFRLAGQFITYHIADPAQLVDSSLTSKRSEFSLTLQMIWSMGPHKPHEF